MGIVSSSKQFQLPFRFYCLYCTDQSTVSKFRGLAETTLTQGTPLNPHIGLMEAEGDEEAVLSSSTQAILNQFLSERRQAEEESAGDPFAENWGMSQFWYTDATAEKVAQEVVKAAKGGRIACLACPSLFRRLRQSFPDADAWLFEYDSRFECSVGARPLPLLGLQLAGRLAA